MSSLSEILEFNRGFVQRREYERYLTDRFPDKKMVILTCMDTRLIELLPRAMNLRNGDVKIIKTAGAIVSHPFGSIMRSIIVAVYELGAGQILVVGHHDCGMAGLSCARILEKARQRGIGDDVLNTLSHAGIDLERWLVGFDRVEQGVRRSVEMIRHHPLVPPDVLVHGLLIHPQTGELQVVIEDERQDRAGSR
ncbi:beta-class carbonic anhydrase [Fontivita pretiosa]|uniref:beta-class carbonic anhydrase n=1 Tax=Fontivita pretiosa TaxID=2989684 RepID=UPI003D1828FE